MAVNTLLLVVAVSGMSRQAMYTIPVSNAFSELIAESHGCFIGSTDIMYSDEIRNYVHDMVNLSEAILSQSDIDECIFKALAEYYIEPNTDYKGFGCYKIIHCGEM